jgi:hypothetical protein
MTEPKKKKRGRPTLFTNEVLQKIRYYSANDITPYQMAPLLGLGVSTIYGYLENHADFSEEIEALRESTKVKAKIVIVDAIQDGDVKVAQWYLERKARDEYSTKIEQKQDITAVTFVDDVPHADIEKYFADMSKDELRDILRGND